MNLPKYVMVSSEIRKDLEGPIALFTRLEVHHLYNRAPWNDMMASDLGERTVKFGSPFGLYRLLVSIGPDAIQGPEPLSLLMFPYLLAVFWYLFRHPKVQLVTLTLEVIPLERKYGRLVSAVMKQVLKRWFARAAVVFWFDKGSYKNLVDLRAPIDKLTYVLYGSWGVDTNQFSIEGPSHRLSDKPVILFVGRLVREKGVQVLIEAFNGICDRGVRASLIIVGDGEYRKVLEEQAEQSCYRTDIHFIGNVKNMDLAPYFRGSDVFVMPSINTRLWVQQISMTTWQAMACGVPIVVTDVGQMREFTPEDVGVVVRENDSDALADQVFSILADPDRRIRMGRAAATYARTNFEITKNIRIAEDEILGVIGRAGRSSV